MPILKSNQAAGYAKDAVVLDLGDIGRQAARIRLNAEAKAAQIINEAERQAQQIIAEAEGIGLQRGYEQGMQQGLEQGRRQGHAEALQQTTEQLAQLQAAWSDVADQLDASRRQMDREARQAVLEFALKMAERLVHRVIEIDPTVVVDQLAAALSLVTRPMDVSVRINPADRTVLAQAMPQLMSEFNQFQHVQLTDDGDIARGGCVVTYGQGLIDATVEKQIERVIDLILPREEHVNVQSEEPAADDDVQTDNEADT